MVNMDELYGENGLMVELIENQTSKDLFKAEFTERGKEIIKEISEYVRNKPIYAATDTEREKYKAEGRSASEVWLDILSKVCDAPFSVYRDMAILLLLPVLDDMVNGVTLAHPTEKGGVE